METYRIEVASDTAELETFVQWLCDHGHNATIGRSTGDYINGVWTAHNEEARAIINKLWEDYCSDY